MPSTPAMFSSKGVATVSAIVFGLAPGNIALTTTDGGTTSGYSEIGNCVIAIRPDRKMMTEITPAKIGRSMKNFDRFIIPSPRNAGAEMKGGARDGRAAYLAAVCVAGCTTTGAPGARRC